MQSDTIFISSTTEDLEIHRHKVFNVLTQLSKRIDGMELFGAHSSTPIDRSLESVRSCEIFICLLGMKYGSFASRGKSFTELEYDEAFRCKKTILVYLIDENEHLLVPKFVDTGVRAEKLTAFKKKLLERHVCVDFSSLEDLAHKVGLDLIKVFEETGKNIRAALEKKNIRKLLIDAGYSSAQSDILVSINEMIDIDHSRIFSFGDNELEEIMESAILAKFLKEGAFSVLGYTVTTREGVINKQIDFLSKGRLSEASLSEAIIGCSDSLELRKLINIAGRLRFKNCCESICKKLFELPNHHRVIEEYRRSYQIRSFYDTIVDALGNMDKDVEMTVNAYIALAKQNERWKVKRVLERAVKRIRSQKS